MQVLLVDGHPLFRVGLRVTLSQLLPKAAVIEAADGRSAMVLAGQHFDLIFLDLYLPDLHGLASLDAVHACFPKSAIAVLADDENPETIKACIQHGAVGYIPKSAKPEITQAALQIVASNGIYLPVQVLACALPSCSVSLSSRQMDVYRCLIRGMSNKLIARELSISEGTVKSHLSATFQALQVRNRTEAVLVSGKVGLRL